MNTANLTQTGLTSGIGHSSQLEDYNNLSGLQSLKYQAKTDKEGALDQVAKQFESIFVSMMIKSMRAANKGFSEGNLLQSSETESYQQMFDSQLALTLSNSKGLGLADVIKRQLSKGSTGMDARSNLSPNGFDPDKAYSLADYPRRSFSSRFSVDDVQQTLAKVDNSLKSLPEAPVRSLESNESSIDFSSPDKFIESLYPYAKQVEQETGIDARLMLAQSALETGWGQHQILKQDGSPSHNLFGIKAQQGWEGDAAQIMTTEYRGGLAMKEQASFRAYGSYGQSFRDYAQFLQSNDRYQSALEQASDPEKFAYALQASGYATDPDYAQKINRIMDRYISDIPSEVSGPSGLVNDLAPDTGIPNHTHGLLR